MRHLVLAALLVCAAAPAVSRPTPADMVYTGGRVYTGSEFAEGLAVRDGRIAAVGPVDDHIGATTRVVDLAGRLVLPAFHDSHMHPTTSVLELERGDLTEAESLEDILKVVGELGGEWVQASGWALTLFPVSGPTAEMLDEAVPDRPAVLWSADGHSAWLNTEALRRAGITAETPDPPGGRIERQPDGSPSGTLREAAVHLVTRELPETPPEDWRAAALEGQALAHRVGIVGVVDAAAPAEALRAYRDLDRESLLTLRVRACLESDPSAGLQQVARMLALRERYGGGRMRPDAVKFFLDGVIESETAALLEPYVGSGSRGALLWDSPALAQVARALDSSGFQLHFHAIGDGAVRQALDVLERMPPGDRRAILAHLELVDLEDIPRFRALGAVASFQPLWAQADPYVLDMTAPIVGPLRARRLYPIGSLVRAGARVAGGSDWSVSSMNPLEAIEVAVTRRAPGAPPGEAWLPNERITLREALAAYTSEGAFATFSEEISGSLEVGKAADMVVLSQDLFEVEPSEISETRVLLTVVDGQVVHGRLPASPSRVSSASCSPRPLKTRQAGQQREQRGLAGFTGR